MYRRIKDSLYRSGTEDGEELEDIKIDRKMIEDKDDNSFDFLRYLQKRKF